MDGFRINCMIVSSRPKPRLTGRMSPPERGQNLLGQGFTWMDFRAESMVFGLGVEPRRLVESGAKALHRLQCLIWQYATPPQRRFARIPTFYTTRSLRVANSFTTALINLANARKHQRYYCKVTSRPFRLGTEEWRGLLAAAGPSPASGMDD